MHQLKYILSFVLVFTLSSTIIGQDENLVYEDEIYLDYIKSVKFHHQGLFTSIPIIDLNSSGRLVLSFDDLEAEDKEYLYEIIHCDKDWQPSDIEEVEFLDGFNLEEINDVNFSRGTFHNYTHYELTLPNDQVKWNLSGNYLLKVYENEYDKILALTRRFMVVEPAVTVLVDLVRPSSVSKIKSHHELRFDINYKNFAINNPKNEIEVVIIQNGRWDNLLSGINPKFITGETMKFNYLDRLNFLALKEFRIFECRSKRYTGERVHSIDINNQGIDVLLDLDESRASKYYHTYDDLNGNYIIETRDDNNDMVTAEYINAIFALDLRRELYEGNIYVVGKFTDWKLKEEFKMQFDSQNNIYVGEGLLKQGFYDYMYVLEDSRGVSFDALEGSWEETENEYTVLVYYSEYGSRYDRLIGLANLNSNRN